MSDELPGPAEVGTFWREAGPDKWFKKDADFDAEISARFGALHAAAAAGGKDDWAESPEGAFALLLLLDQFSRNMFRGSPSMFAQDARARGVAGKAVEAKFDQGVDSRLRPFFYLPFEHSESIYDQERSIVLHHALGNANALFWARKHEAVIRRFGRFPHRNAVLGRHTSPAEQAFLDAGGFAG